MVNCFIIEDEKPAIRVIEKYIHRIPSLNLKGAMTNPLDALDVISRSHIDLVFLDIQMDEMNGLQVATKLTNHTEIIFCTGYSDFAVSGFDLGAVDYLLKPIPFDRFERAVQRALRKIKHGAFPDLGKAIDNDYIFVHSDQKGRRKKIDLEKIDFIESRDKYVAIHAEGEITLTYSTLKDLEDFLPASEFIRVHKSYIVQIKKIAIIANSELLFTGYADPVPVSDSYRSAFINRISMKS